MKERLSGVFPPVTTPFSPDGELLFESLEQNVRGYIHSELAGVLLLGSNGEAVHLTEEEKVQVVRRIEPLIPSDRDLLVGVSFSTLSAASGFLEKIDRYRIRAVLVSVPSYYKNRMSRSALRGYFYSLADRSPFGILVYNIPQYSGISLEPDLVAELAAHDNIVGMKDSSGNLTYLQGVLHRTAGADFQVLLGSAQAWGPALSLGIEAGILAVACAFPELPIEVLCRAQKGRSIREAQMLLCRIGNAVTVQYGIPGLKYAMSLAGREGGECRLPLLPLEDEGKILIDQLFQELQESSVAC